MSHSIPEPSGTETAPTHSETGSRLGGWRSLRRVTTSGRYVPEIDGLRFIAIISVIFYHLGLMSWLACGYCTPLEYGPGRIVNQLDRGVPLFFVLSGLILGLPFANQHLLNGKQVRLGPYFLRRLTRLEPPYLINLLIRFPMIPAARNVPWAMAATHLGFSFFYLHSLVYGTFPMVHIPSWSLEVEVQFYLLAPLLAAIFLARSPAVRRAALLVSIVAFSALRLYTPGPQQTRIHLSLISFLQYFLIGFLLSDWYLTLMPRMKSSWLWDVAGIAALGVAFFVRDPVVFLMLPLLFCIVVAAAFKSIWFRRILRTDAVSTLGGMCYSIYLTHSLILQGCFWFLNRMHWIDGRYWSDYLRAALVSLPPIFAVGIGFYILIERPCMDKDWPRKLANFFARRTPEAGSQAS